MDPLIRHSSGNNNSSQGHGHRHSHQIRKHKKRLSQDQLRVLEANFNFNNKLDPELKSRLAAELGVPARQVAIWYQNKRAREKNHSLEASHRALQLQIETVLSQNARLKGEVERLKTELSKLQNMYGGAAYTTSSGIGNGGHHLDRELYASLIGGGGGGGAGNVYVAQDHGHNFFGSSLS